MGSVDGSSQNEFPPSDMGNENKGVISSESDRMFSS